MRMRWAGSVTAGNRSRSLSTMVLKVCFWMR